MKKRKVGRIQQAVRRAFIASDGKPLRTIDLLRYAYPRLSEFERWHYRNMYRSAPRFAVKRGRVKSGPGRAFWWAPKAELLRLIRGE
jgi:hypothetical protein